jgi:hypothetical protein
MLHQGPKTPLGRWDHLLTASLRTIRERNRDLYGFARRMSEILP